MPQAAPPNGTVDDADLVRRLRARDPAAMELLLQQHGSKLYGVAFQLMRNETDAEDVMQEALLSVWRKIDSFEGRAAFTSWLYRLTANAALMRLRKDKRRALDVSTDEDNEYAPLQLEDQSPLPSASLQGNELKEKIQNAIDRLPEPYRTVVLLKDVEEFSLEEIAELTGVTVAAVKSRLHRARLTLRNALLPYLNSQEVNQP